jgi:hypothetical protein
VLPGGFQKGLLRVFMQGIANKTAAFELNDAILSRHKNLVLGGVGRVSTFKLSISCYDVAIRATFY